MFSMFEQSQIQEYKEVRSFLLLFWSFSHRASLHHSRLPERHSAKEATGRHFLRVRCREPPDLNQSWYRVSETATKIRVRLSSHGICFLSSCYFVGPPLFSPDNLISTRMSLGGALTFLTPSEALHVFFPPPTPCQLSHTSP